MIVDTGVLYAAMAPRDRNHAACAKLLRATRELLLPAPVLVELDYFLTELTASLSIVRSTRCYAGSRTVPSPSWTWRQMTTHGYGSCARSTATGRSGSSMLR